MSVPTSIQSEVQVSQPEIQEEIVSEAFSASIQEEPELSSAPSQPLDSPLPERKKKDLEDNIRRLISAETDLQNGKNDVERLKVQLLEEDNERLRSQVKQLQKVEVYSRHCRLRRPVRLKSPVLIPCYKTE